MAAGNLVPSLFNTERYRQLKGKLFFPLCKQTLNQLCANAKSKQNSENETHAHTATRVYVFTLKHTRTLLLCVRQKSMESFRLCSATYDACTSCGKCNALLDASGILCDATVNSSCSPVDPVAVLVSSGRLS